MKTPKPRRHALDKPKNLLESTRAQWVAIGLVITLLVLVCNVAFRIDPSPYLQAVMLLIGAGVLGWSVDSAVKAYRVNSDTSTARETVAETRQESVKVEKNITIVEKIERPRDYDSDEVG